MLTDLELQKDYGFTRAELEASVDEWEAAKAEAEGAAEFCKGIDGLEQRFRAEAADCARFAAMSRDLLSL